MEPGDGSPADAWRGYFWAHRAHPADVCDVVLRLHKAGRTEEVIACVEAALTAGQSQPWMYTVLALSMERASRPRDEIERVLLSGVDFSAVNVPNLIYSAAFLTRFGAKDRALELYRQASLIDPARLEPYVLALGLARERQDAEAVGWAATGILTRAWNKDHPRLHREAEDALRELEAARRSAGDDARADELLRLLARALERDLEIELSWSGEADLDLLVEEPAGAICSAGNPGTTGGGVFVHDGMGAGPRDMFDRYVCPRGQPGEYRAIVRHVRGEVAGKRAVLRVVRYRGTPRELEERFTVPLSGTERVVRVSLQHGRLDELAAVPLLDAAPSQQVATGKRRPEFARRTESPRRGPRGNGAPGGAGGNVGYQPVISVLSEGVAMSALAVVSGDRRYVRMSLVPTFSAITGVNTFSFINGGGNPSGGGGGGGQAGGGGGGGVQQPR